MELFQLEMELLQLEMELYSDPEDSPEDSMFDVQVNEVLPSKSCNYQVEAFLGQGAFGKVARCRKLKTEEHVAVKVLGNDSFEDGQHEAETMEKMEKLNPDKNSMLKLIEHFIYKDHFCLVYELMDVSLYDFMAMRSFQPFPLNEIRVIGQQLLVALKALKTISMVHGDIKPGNIMLVNSESQPLKVKLIDFGIATEASNLWEQGIFQKPPYMSPEVVLHLPSLDESMDMWSLGCVLAYLYLGEDLYPHHCKYEYMRMILQINGQPDVDFLDSAFDSSSFFDLVQEFPKHMWYLKSPEQYEEETGEEIVEHFGLSRNFCSLDDLKLRQPRKMVPIVRRDTLAFISLLKQMLAINPRKRISPSQALCHNFFTLKHLPLASNDSYLYSAQQLMGACNFEEENSLSIECREESSGTCGSCDSSDHKTATRASLSINDKTESFAANHKEESIKAPGSVGKHFFRHKTFEARSIEETKSVQRCVLKETSVKNRICEEDVEVLQRTEVKHQKGTSKITVFQSGECETNDSKEEIYSPTIDDKSQEDTSKILDFGSRTCDTISSEEEMSSPRAGTEDQQGDPAKQVSEKDSVGEVKPVKKPFRGIRKFFSRLFKPVWTVLKKD